ncbi:MAG: peptide chain release factor N(5)-glutamine methyltransferase [Clostridia bacterium]
MKIRELIERASSLLDEGRISDPLKEAFVLFREVFLKDTTYIYSHPDEKVGSEMQGLFFDAVEKRKKGVPLAYITGRAHFMSLTFHVEAGVLIPRPETEILCEKALLWIKGMEDEEIRVLDLCSGSGCIGISIARHAKRTRVLLSDSSEKCGEVSRKNIHALKLDDRVAFVNSDLFGKISGRFHIIASNPPYVKEGDLPLLMEDVRDHEPHLALNGGPDGLLFYRKIINQAKAYLFPGGCLFLEAGIHQAESIEEMLFSQGYARIETFRDHSGIKRVVKAVSHHL